uniref:VOC domain-containing protein n=1 Tax=Fundidesulfovibrio putealis TaxID=270496 RepID=A0A7C4AGA3_9BACT
MKTAISHIFVTVDDHDKALAYFEGVLGFVKTWDLPMENGWRWLSVTPGGPGGVEIVINKASNDAERALIGRQSAGELTPLLILGTDDIAAQYAQWKAKGVDFLGEPVTLPWGTSVNFRDPYGNLYLLMQENPEFTTGKVA